MKGYGCLTCGEDKELELNITDISNKDVKIEIECKNCLSKMYIDGKYIFIKYTVIE